VVSVFFILFFVCMFVFSFLCATILVNKDVYIMDILHKCVFDWSEVFYDAEHDLSAIVSDLIVFMILVHLVHQRFYDDVLYKLTSYLIIYLLT